MSDDLLVSVQDDVVVVRLRRPRKVNALTKNLLSRLPSVFGEARHSIGVILAGEGKNFSSGFDLDELTGTGQDDDIDALLGSVARAIDEIPVPVVAAVEGACVGAGFDLAMMCDLVVAGQNSFFAVPSTRLGVVYRTAAVRDVIARAGTQAGALLFLFGERLSARVAFEWALIAELVPDGRAMGRAQELLRGSSRGVPQAVAGTKKLLRTLRSSDALDAISDELARSVEAAPERIRAVEEARRRRRG